VKNLYLNTDLGTLDRSDAPPVSAITPAWRARPSRELLGRRIRTVSIDDLSQPRKHGSGDRDLSQHKELRTARGRLRGALTLGSKGGNLHSDPGLG
jgi:hypothetical protein